MKEMLDIIPGTSNQKMNLPKTDLISEIRDKLKNVSTMFNLMIPVKNADNRGESSSEDGDDYENVLAIGSKRVNLKNKAVKGITTNLPIKKIAKTVLLDPETENLKVTRPKFTYRRTIQSIEDKNFGPLCKEFVKFLILFNFIFILNLNLQIKLRIRKDRRSNNIYKTREK